MEHHSRSAGWFHRGVLIFALPAVCASVWSPASAAGKALGLFEAHGDVGEVQQKGSVQFDAKTGEYRITGGGENMWGTKDAFHYAWKRLSGDLAMTAAVSLPDKTGQPHRKAGWVVRQGLEADAPYADAVVHGDGLISLQYRLVKGGPTLEVKSPVKAPATVRLERTGDLFSLSVSRDGKRFAPAGAVSVPLTDPVHVGLGVTAHDAAGSATAVLSRVALEHAGPVAAADRVLESHLEVLSIDTGEREVVYTTRDHIEAPNWSRDGRFFLFNRKGKLYSLPREGGQPQLIDTGTADRLNNDHGLSPDAQWLAISHSPKNESIIYVLPATGGTPRQVTALGPSYWHGWSPDGKTLAYCARRNGEFDVYTIPADAESSTAETRLTTAPGLDDGPDYSPDGQVVFFNSERSGLMKIWRMKPDGTEQQQVTSGDEWADWFAHPSPDGKWLVFVSFDKSVKGHPPNKDVALRIMPLAGGEPKVLARLFGGQGTINVPSWSPDSRAFAFVSYRLVRP
jgi:Tol biopolymer transport system component